MIPRQKRCRRLPTLVTLGVRSASSALRTKTSGTHRGLERKGRITHDGSLVAPIGVIGAGRVGAVLAAALGAAGHKITAVAWRVRRLPHSHRDTAAGRPRRQADRRRQGVRRPAAHRPRRLPRQRRPDARRIRGDPLRSAHRPHERPTRPRRARARRRDRRARPIAMHPAMTFTGTDIDLARLGGCAFGVTAGVDDRELAQTLVDDLGGRVDVGRRGQRAFCTTLPLRTEPTISSPLSPRRWICSASAGSTDPAATLAAASRRRARQHPRLRRRSTHRADRARRCPHRAGAPETMAADRADRR